MASMKEILDVGAMSLNGKIIVVNGMVDITADSFGFQYTRLFAGILPQCVRILQRVRKK